MLIRWIRPRPFWRLFSNLTETERSLLQAERQEMETDVLIVGGGPAGLAAAIRLKQLSPDRSVTVLEKASEIGIYECYYSLFMMI
jgi:NADPH-dependent 2,4-dienoyl-CoA reductase/sulfur reductase-like enzyme